MRSEEERDERVSDAVGVAPPVQFLKPLRDKFYTKMELMNLEPGVYEVLQRREVIRVPVSRKVEKVHPRLEVLEIFRVSKLSRTEVDRLGWS